MSNFGEALFELLSLRSAFNKPNNPARKVIDNSVGEWLDRYDVLEFYNQLFIDSATGKYLDLFGEDYGVFRRINETDEDYLQRIISEKSDYLTPSTLKSIFGLDLYSSVQDFNPLNNDLTSDNPFINQERYMAEADESLKTLINNKFIIGEEIDWL